MFGAFNSFRYTLHSFQKFSLLGQVNYFSKYISKSRAKRLPLTTKRIQRGYKKGYGATREGYLTSKGMKPRVIFL